MTMIPPYSLSRSLLTGCLLLVLLWAPAALAAETPPDPEDPSLAPAERITLLLKRIKYEQQRMESLQADFTQRKESQLLLEPEESGGEFWYRAPDAVRWDFTKPDRTRVVIKEGEMLTWHQDLGQAERVEVGGKADKVMQYLSASNSIETLERYFKVQAAFPGTADAPFRLDLEPRYRRVAKRIKAMSIHLDRKGYFPTYVKYVEPDGDVTELRFLEAKKNLELTDDLFEVELPPDVEVKTLELGR